MRDLELVLRDVARDLRTDSSPVVVDAVLERVRQAPVPRPTLLARLRRRTAAVVALVVALLVTTLAVSPVGATVAEWFGFHGVMVREGTPTGGDPSVPTEAPGMSLAEAAELVGFTPLVPTVLGAPEGVGVSDDGRVVSLTWGRDGHAVRLDEFTDGLHPFFWKTARDARRVDVAGGDGLWFATPHDIVVTREGKPETVPPRTAGPTLVWVVGDRTLRLEGDLTLARAVEIADSVS